MNPSKHESQDLGIPSPEIETNATLSISPAPWGVKPYEYRKRGRSYSRPAAVIAADGHWIATEVCGHDFNGSSMANARLIAAAPDIYQTAQALLDKIDNITTDEFSKGGERTEREALRAVLERL